jgi:hypothetical protein
MRSYRRSLYRHFSIRDATICGQTNVLSYVLLIFASAAGGDNASSLSTVGNASLIDWIGQVCSHCLGHLELKPGTVFASYRHDHYRCRPPVTHHFEGRIETQQNGEAAVDDEGTAFTLPARCALVVSGYSMSFGPLTLLLTSELFPAEIRGRALGANTIVTYLCAVITYTFLSAKNCLARLCIWFPLIVTLLGICFAYTAIPDTGERLSRKRKRSERDALVESGCENLTDSAVAGGEVTPLATFHREVNVQQQY